MAATIKRTTLKQLCKGQSSCYGPKVKNYSSNTNPYEKKNYMGHICQNYM